jgi:transposase-like protein
MEAARAGQRGFRFDQDGGPWRNRHEAPRFITIEFKRQVRQEFASVETLYGLAKRHAICRNLLRVWVAEFEAGEFYENPKAASLITGYEARIARSGDRPSRVSQLGMLVRPGIGDASERQMGWMIKNALC